MQKLESLSNVFANFGYPSCVGHDVDGLLLLLTQTTHEYRWRMLLRPQVQLLPQCLGGV